MRQRKTAKKDIEILATLLLAYPEVARVVFDPRDKSLTLIFLCRGTLSKEKRSWIKNQYLDSVDAYLMLTGKKPLKKKTSFERLESSFYAFQVERDVSSLSPGELNLTSDLISSLAKVVVASDGTTRSENQEYPWSPRMFLQEILDQVKSLESPKRLVALREGEKVMIFERQ